MLLRAWFYRLVFLNCSFWVKLREAKLADSIDIEEGVTVDIDEKGHIVGIEILDASEKLNISDLVNISIENLPLEKVAEY